MNNAYKAVLRSAECCCDLNWLIYVSRKMSHIPSQIDRNYAAFQVATWWGVKTKVHLNDSNKGHKGQRELISHSFWGTLNYVIACTYNFASDLKICAYVLTYHICKLQINKKQNLYEELQLASRNGNSLWLCIRCSTMSKLFCQKLRRRLKLLSVWDRVDY